jgi:hypothetical protein
MCLLVKRFQMVDPRLIQRVMQFAFHWLQILCYTSEWNISLKWMCSSEFCYAERISSGSSYLRHKEDKSSWCRVTRNGNAVLMRCWRFLIIAWNICGTNTVTCSMARAELLHSTSLRNVVRGLCSLWGSQSGMKRSILRDIMSYTSSTLKVNRRFGRTFRFHLYVWRVSPAWSRWHALTLNGLYGGIPLQNNITCLSFDRSCRSRHARICCS